MIVVMSPASFSNDHKFNNTPYSRFRPDCIGHHRNHNSHRCRNRTSRLPPQGIPGPPQWYSTWYPCSWTNRSYPFRYPYRTCCPCRYHHRSRGSPGYRFISEGSKDTPSIDTRSVYNKPHHTGSQSDTCVNLQSKGWYFLLLYLP